MKIEAVVLLIFTISSLSQGFRILGIFPSCTKSHDLFASSLTRGLIQKGHNITVLTALPNLYDDGIVKLPLEDLNGIRDCKWFHNVCY